MEVSGCFTPPPLYTQGKSSQYPLDRKLSGPQSRSGHGGEEKNYQPLPGLKPLVIQPVVQRYTSESSENIKLSYSVAVRHSTVQVFKLSLYP
jgi:hypothetical protein